MSAQCPGPLEQDDEVTALVKQLHHIEQRLQVLTDGEVDAVVGPAGGAYLLRQAQRRLVDSEGEQRRMTETQTAVLNALPAYVALLDARGVIVSVNEAWRRFGAGNGQQMAGFGVGIDYPGLCEAVTGDAAEDALQAARGLRSVLDGRLPVFSLEYACHSPTEQRWFRMMVAPLRAGAAEGAVVMHVDVSERKQSEIERDRERQLLRTLIDSLPDMIYTMDAAGRFAVCNPATLVYCKVESEAALIGKTVFASLPPTVAETFHVDDLRVLAGDAVRNREERDVDAAGDPVWYLTSKLPLRAGSGEVVGLVAISRDITHQKRAEEEARALAERLTGTLESLSDGFYTLDPAWRFTYVNQQAEHLLERGRATLLGRVIWDEYPQTAGTECQRAFEQAVREQVPVSFEQEYAPLGKWFDVKAYPSARGLGVYFRDVTARVRDQKALRELNAELEARVQARTAELNQAREDAEQASRAKSAFLATMSHEIRTPMNGVIGMIDVLRQTSLLGHQSEMVELIQDSALSLLGIVEDILDFSKIEAGRLDIHREPMPMADVVENVCGMLDHMAGKSGVRLTVFVDPAIPVALRGDGARLRQVLVNLVGNAIKFSSGQQRPGEVAVRARVVEQDTRHATVEVSVADNGIGMDEATLARLFTPFQQGDVSTTRRFGGTGLGLAISHMLVGLMGGRLSVRSEHGNGSQFTVHLVLERVDADAPADPSAVTIAGLACRVVGDESLADDLAAYLIHAGARVARSPDLAHAETQPHAPGLEIWLLLPSLGPVHPQTFRPREGGQAGADTRFVVFGTGHRRRPRRDAIDWVSLDIDVLFRRTLYRALALAAGTLRETSATGDATAVVGDRPAPTREQARRQGRLILVAEDNATNRQVIRQQLQLVGVVADFAANGREALERWRSGQYSLLLTDLHMPELDGFALAAAVRAEEGEEFRIPIVALTANALRDDQARSSAIGMDDWLVKPVRLPLLKATIEKWLGKAGHQDAEPLVEEGHASAVPADGRAGSVDLSVLVELVGNDTAVIASVLHTFRSGATPSADDIRGATATADTRRVAEAAHRMKSGARAIGAWRLGDACEAMEWSAEAGNADELVALLPRFDAEIEAVLKCIDSDLTEWSLPR